MAGKKELTAFQRALLDAALESHTNIPEEEALSDPFSPEFKAWADDFIRKNGTRRLRTATVLKRILIAAAILLLLAGTAMAIPAVRTAILDLFFHETEERIAVTFDPVQAANAPDTIQVPYAIDCVPTDYTLIMDDTQITTVCQWWKNSEGQRILFTQQPLRHNLTNKNWWGYDSLENTRRSILLGDYQVEVIETEENYKLIWTNNEYLFTLELPYSVTEEEMQAIFASWGPRDKE